jgi:hypothetical protein
MLVPAVFAVLMKMNLCLWDKIMRRAGKSAITSHYACDDKLPVLVVSCAAPFRQGQSKCGSPRRPLNRIRGIHARTVNSTSHADDLFSEPFPFRSHSEDSR